MNNMEQLAHCPLFHFVSRNPASQRLHPHENRGAAAESSQPRGRYALEQKFFRVAVTLNR